MAKLNFKIHPLFFIFGLYFAFIGKVFSFLLFTLTACIHEFGHFLTSSKLGYKLNTIILMPYGALLFGNIDNVSYKDECKIALAGPLMNLYITIIFVALWWFIPTLYPFSQEIVISNLTLGLINLLPCYPLDGGRFLLGTLSLCMPSKTAEKLVRVLGFFLSLTIFALFIYSIFTTLNITILFFAIFMFIGAISKNDKAKYVKIYSLFNALEIKKPTIVKKIAVNENATFKDVYKYLSNDYIYEIEVYSINGTLLKTYKGNLLYSKLKNESPYKKIYSPLK